MRVEVYWGGELAAVLVYGREPVYSGTRGDRVRRLLERRRPVRNLWSGEVARGPRSDTLAWWLSSIHGAHLPEKGFTVFANNMPLGDTVPQTPAEGDEEGSPSR